MIKTATSANVARVLDTLVLGFSSDPVMRWLMPEPQMYMKSFPEILRLFGGGAFSHQGAYYNDAYTCASLWLPPEQHPDEEGLGRLFESILPDKKLDQIMALFAQMDAFHPDEPCFHLAFIATDPAHIGKGQGAAMMEHVLKVCDLSGKPVYLESTNAANLSIYRRHGFEQMGVIETEGAPKLFPMLRSARVA